MRTSVISLAFPGDCLAFFEEFAAFGDDQVLRRHAAGDDEIVLAVPAHRYLAERNRMVLGVDEPHGWLASRGGDRGIGQYDSVPLRGLQLAHHRRPERPSRALLKADLDPDRAALPVDHGRDLAYAGVHV